MQYTVSINFDMVWSYLSDEYSMVEASYVYVFTECSKSYRLLYF